MQLDLLSRTTLASCKMRQKVRRSMTHVMSVGSENENRESNYG